MNKATVELTPKAQKQFAKAPIEVQSSAARWVAIVERLGVKETASRGGKGLNDKALSGQLKGLRSIRLNRAWRLYYKASKTGAVEVVTVERIDKHKY